jgi:hypothetical protein
MLASAKASAAFHIMKVVQVYASPTASYVQLQMYAAGQTVVSGHKITVYNAAGAEIAASTFTFNANVANGADQANILVGTSTVMAQFGVAPDFTMTANLDPAGGAVCFDATPVDCFTWGNFTGVTADKAGGVTSPFAVFTTMAAKRKIAAGNATLLEAADDTDVITADFEAVSPAPTNNGGVTGGTDGGTTVMDSGVTPGTDSGTTPPADSGISTTPTPGGGATTERTDSGTTSGAAAPESDDSGCNTSSRSSEGWSTTLGLGAAAAMFIASRRRRAKR